MQRRITLMEAACLIITVCLIKSTFFSGESGDRSIVPSAHATGSILEWQGSNRIVTAGNDGSTTYVWDYDAKTEVRKYFIEKGKLKMQRYKIDKE